MLKIVRILIVRILTILYGVLLMREENLVQIYSYLLEFTSLFHEKFSPAFHSHQRTKYKCNKNQNKAIFIIGKKKIITPTDLGKCLDMKKGSLTTLIDSLEKIDLVHRNSDIYDRRKILISLTDKGEEYLKEKQEEFKKTIVTVFNSLDEKEIDEFSSSMKTITDILRKI